MHTRKFSKLPNSARDPKAGARPRRCRTASSRRYAFSKCGPFDIERGSSKPGEELLHVIHCPHWFPELRMSFSHWLRFPRSEKSKQKSELRHFADWHVVLAISSHNFSMSSCFHFVPPTDSSPSSRHATGNSVVVPTTHNIPSSMTVARHSCSGFLGPSS